MTIQIVQTCDGCKTQRELRVPARAADGGWREVSTAKHLCADCIDKALTPGTKLNQNYVSPTPRSTI